MLQGVYLMKTEGVRLRLGSSFSPPLCVSRVSCRSDACPPPSQQNIPVTIFSLTKGCSEMSFRLLTVRAESAHRFFLNLLCSFHAYLSTASVPPAARISSGSSFRTISVTGPYSVAKCLYA